MVVYWVFHGLSQVGIFTDLQVVVERSVMDAQSIAQNCTPKIRDIGAFWRCIENPPAYKSNSDEVHLRQLMEQAISVGDGGIDRNPYEPTSRGDN